MCAMDYVPFVTHKSESQYRMDFKRILEGVIIAAIAAMVVMYQDQGRTQEKLEAIREDMKEVKANQKKIMDDLYIPQWNSERKN